MNHSFGAFALVGLFHICLVSFCAANDLFCQLFDENEKSLSVYCENYRGGVPAECTEDIYSIEPSQVIAFKAAGCDEDTVLEFLKRLHSVRHLDVSQSEFHSLSWLDKALGSVVKFNASYNRLAEIDFSFAKMPYIGELDLSHNSISTLNATTFHAATHLTQIDLSYNLLDDLSLSCKLFWNSYRLKEIDLVNNFLTEVPTFPANVQLKALNLDDNPIATFGCVHFYSMPFVSVYLSWKYLISFFGYMDCHDTRLRVIRGDPRAGEAILPAWSEKNELHCRPNGFANLRYFMAGTNAFENVAEILPCLGSTLAHLDLSGNSIGALSADAFERFIDLNRLYLRNTQLAAFDFDLLQRQQYLIVLDLSENSLKSIENISQLSRIQLDEFSIAGNGLASTPEMLDCLQSTIERLTLAGNFLGATSESTFQRFVSLKSLNISDTALYLANDFNPFRLLTELKTLDISHNSLDTLNFAVLAITLNQLHEFYAADCEITNALDVIAYLSSAIRILDLSENPMQHFQLNATHLQMLRDLQYLNLSNTNLMRIEHDAFYQQSMLHSLDISNNQLREFDVRLVGDKLECLRLDRNELKEVKNFHAAHFPRLQSMTLSQNWLSTESLQRLLNELSNIEFVDNAYDQKKLQPSKSQAIGHFLYAVYDKVKFW